jgi:hypothetical protein
VKRSLGGRRLSCPNGPTRQRKQRRGKGSGWRGGPASQRALLPPPPPRLGCAVGVLNGLKAQEVAHSGFCLLFFFSISNPKYSKPNSNSYFEFKSIPNLSSSLMHKWNPNIMWDSFINLFSYLIYYHYFIFRKCFEHGLLTTFISITY